MARDFYFASPKSSRKKMLVSDNKKIKSIAGSFRACTITHCNNFKENDVADICIDWILAVSKIGIMVSQTPHVSRYST